MKRNRFFLCLFATLLLPLSFAQAQQSVAVPASREEISLSFAPVVKKAAPAVVNIYTKTRVRVQGASPFLDDPFFNQFFGGKGLAFGDRNREKIVSSLGSGVIIKPDGTIVTSLHVIKDADAITVALSDKREFEAKITMRDPQTDLAFLKIEVAGALPYLDIRDSDSLEVGDLVLALGNPFGIGQTVTQGIISGLARKAVGVSDYQFFIQTDAAINPGNSGGALVDMAGRLVGINTAIYSKSGGSMGIGFAIPGNMVAALLGNKVEAGRAVKPWIGVSTQPVTSDIANAANLATPEGALLSAVFPGSPAERAGLKAGDIVIAVGNSPVSSDREMMYRIALNRIGDTASVKFLRDGKQMLASVPMLPPTETVPRDIRKIVGRHPLGGVTVANLSPALAVEIGLDEYAASGVVILEMNGGIAQSLSFRPGDIILEVNGATVNNTLALEKLMQRGSKVWNISYKRGNQVLTLEAR